MRMLVVLTGFGLAFVLNVSSAEAAAWCAWYDAYTYNCGFRTLEQCRATVSGDPTALCARNVERGNPRHEREP